MMVISNFLPRVIQRDDEHEPCTTDANTNGINSARYWSNRNKSIISGRLQELANSPPGITRIAYTPTTQLYSNAKHLNPRIACHGELDSEDPRTPMSYLEDEVIRNSKKNDKLPSRNFVQKLVTVLEGKRHGSVHCKADEEFVMCYHSRPVFSTNVAGLKSVIEPVPAHRIRYEEQRTEFRNSEIDDEPISRIRNNEARRNYAGQRRTEFRGDKIEEETYSEIRNNERYNYDRLQRTELRDAKIVEETSSRIGNNETHRNIDKRIGIEVLHDVKFEEEASGSIKNEESKGARPKNRGTSTKKPVCLESRSIYRTPEKRKKIPRKRSFKNLLSTFTDWAGKRKPVTKRKKVIFENEDKSLEGVLTTGGKSMNPAKGKTSLQFITNELLLLNNDVARSNSGTFSTFLKSSASKSLEESSKASNSERDSNCSALEISVEERNILPSRVKQIAQKLSNLPNDSRPESKFSRPCLLKTMQNASSNCGEVAVELRRTLNESLYDIPNPKPKAKDNEEMMAMKRKHSSLPNATENGRSLFLIEEETHYAIVRPRTVEGCVSYENLSSISAGSDHDDPMEKMKLKMKKIERRETAN